MKLLKACFWKLYEIYVKEMKKGWEVVFVVCYISKSSILMIFHIRWCIQGFSIGGAKLGSGAKPTEVRGILVFQMLQEDCSKE